MTANSSARNQHEPLTNLRNCFNFWLRRFFRIAPSYYLSLIIAILLGDYFLSGYQQLQVLYPARWPEGGVYDPSRINYSIENILLHLSFLFGLHPTYSFSTFLPDWSLSLEMQFYVAFPLILVITQKLGVLKSTIFLGFFVFLLGLFVYKSTHYYEPSLLIFKLNYFLAGIFLFHALMNKNKTKSLFLCATLLVSIDYRYHFQMVVLPFIFVCMCIVGWLEVNHRTPRLINSIINNIVTRFLSDTSYGVYLFHGFFISLSGVVLNRYHLFVDSPPSHRVIFILLLVLALSYPFAYLIYKFIELPGINLGKRIGTYMLANPRTSSKVKFNRD